MKIFIAIHVLIMNMGMQKKVIAFGISANGDYICFDYRKCNENPCIILMYHDDFYEDENGDTKMVTSHIADSFDAFFGYAI